MKVLMKHIVTLSKTVGYWPLKTKNRTALFFYKMYYYITLLFYISVTGGMILGVPHTARQGLQKFVNSISISCQFTYGLIKLFCFSLPVMKSLFKIISVTEKNILESKNFDLKAIYMKYCNLNNKVDLIWIILVCANDVAFITSPWIMTLTDPDESLTLPLDAYFPYDYLDYYKSTYAFVLFQGLFASIYLTISNIIYVAIMIFVTSQLAILKYEILEGIDTTKYSHEEIYQNLRKITMYYQNISNFLGDLNQIVKFLNFIYFLICIGHTSMIGFEIVTDDFSVQLVRNILYLGASIVDLIVWYSFGNAITLEHAAVLNAIWESDWYNCSLKNKKTILMIMIQFKNPLKLSVGFSYDMSLETMVMVLRMSMSYMITLKQFYAMKESTK